MQKNGTHSKQESTHPTIGMEPMPLRTRRLFAILSFFAFIIVLPVVALYASGYRVKGFALVSTGGIHVSTPAAGITISLNGEEQDRSGLFQKNFFFDTLDSGSYVIQAESDAYYPWTKTVIVEPGVVTDVSVLTVTQPLRVRELVIGSATSTPVAATSTTRTVTKDTYDAITESFLATSTLALHSAPNTPLSVRGVADAENNVSLVVQNGNLIVRWERSGQQPPGSFCIRPSVCTAQFLLEEGPETVTQARFFAGGALYTTEQSGVVFTEIDNRPPIFSIPVYTKPNARFSILNGALYIDDAGNYFEVSGF